MKLKDFFIRIDIKRKREIEPIEVVQGDTNSNALNITLLDGGIPYDLYDLNVKIIFRKSDGTTVEQTDIEKINDVQGKIRCILKSNTIASPGEVIAEVKVFENERTVSSTTFRFYVRKSLEDDETVESTNEFTTLTRLIGETNDLIAEVRQIEAQVPENVIERIDNLEELIDTLEGEVIDKVSISDIANTDTENNPYKVLGANVGYDLGREIDTLNDKLDSKHRVITGDILAFARSCGAGLTSFFTTSPISNVPAGPYLEYSNGYVLSDGSGTSTGVVDIVIYAIDTGEIYANHFNNTWKGWKKQSQTAV